MQRARKSCGNIAQRILRCGLTLGSAAEKGRLLLIGGIPKQGIVGARMGSMTKKESGQEVANKMFDGITSFELEGK